jgi:hypothetical protein
LSLAALVVFYQNCSVEDQSPAGSGANSSFNNTSDIAITSVTPDSAVYIGSALNLEAVAVSTSGKTLTYQWFLDNMIVATGPTYTVASAASGNGGIYTVKVMNGNQTASANVAVTVKTAPTIAVTTQPVGFNISAGGSGALSVVASASEGSPTYQWYKNNVAVPGATAATYSIANAQGSEGGTYKVRISAGPTAVESNPAVVGYSYSVYAGNGCVNGYCACVTPNQPNVPYQPSAKAICVFKGYTDVVSFTTASGPTGVNHCGANGTGCFVNGNPGNIVCNQVICK